MTSDKLKVIVFDLDCTLWPFLIDRDLIPPFKKLKNGQIVDIRGAKIKCFPEVPEVLNSLYEQDYIIAAASRTGQIEGARQLIELFGWNKYFSYIEIFPGPKVKHINNIKKQAAVDYDEILFFDDGSRNIAVVRNLGVASVLVTNGITKSIVEEGMKEYLRQQSLNLESHS